MVLESMSIADTALIEMGRISAAPTTIGALLLVDGEGLLDDNGRVRLNLVRAHIDANLHRTPRDRQRFREVPWGLGRPVWVDAENFDVADHVRAETLAEPTREALYALASRCCSEPFDSSRPLWDVVAIDGLADGRVGILFTAHHAMLDGVSAAEWMLTRTSHERASAAPPPPLPWSSAPQPSAARLIGSAAGKHARHVGRLGRYAGKAVLAPRRAVARARHVYAASRASLGGQTPPTLSLNHRTGDALGLETIAIPLDDLAMIRRSLGGTINDVLLAGIAGGLRRLLESRGEFAPGLSVTVRCPISIRPPGDTKPGNHVAILTVDVDVSEPSSLQRLTQIQTALNTAKSRTKPEHLNFMLELVDFMVPSMIRPAAQASFHRSNCHTGLSNIVGPREPLWFLDSRVEEVYPITGPLGDWSLSTGAVSYAGTMYIATRYDVGSVPDIDVHKRGIEAELADLLSEALAKADVQSTGTD